MKAVRHLASIAAATLTLAILCPGVSMAAEYLLGPQDKLRLKIFEWRPSRDTIFEWTALNDEFVVGPAGTLSLPFVGVVPAAGQTPESLGTFIGSRLRDHMRLGRAPDVAVEVVEFRPFYIVGDVTKPGEFPYRPGLTVLQALSVAGGLRTRDEDRTRLEREVIAGRGEISLLSLYSVGLLAKKARLEAELAAAESINFPPQLTGAKAATVSITINQERAIFSARKEGLNTQVRALQSLREFLVQEVAALEKQLTFHDRQIALVEKELAGVSKLVDKGYTSAPREISLQRTLADVQSSRLSAETALLRARQEIGRTDISILQLRNSFTNEVTASLRETQTLLEENGRKSDTAAEMLYESEVSAPRLVQRSRERAKPTYVIVRKGEAGMTEIEAEENTEVSPGDTVKIEIPFMDIADDLSTDSASQSRLEAASLPPTDAIGITQAQQ